MALFETLRISVDALATIPVISLIMNDTKDDDTYQSFTHFLEIIKTLHGPDGCPWDKEQTPGSLCTHLVEELYETIEAIGDNDPIHVREELGDLLHLVSMITQIYSESGEFTIKEVIDEVSAKLIRRHPHVFGDKQVQNTGEVLKNWDRIKTEIEGRAELSSMEGIPGSLPPLERCLKIQKKAAKQGFDWPDTDGPKKKIFEEMHEIESAVAQNSPGEIEAEIGDLLFSVVNFSRHLSVDPSLALARANSKFMKRFKSVEDRMKNDRIPMSPANIEEMDRYWDLVKTEISSHT